MIPKIIHYCWFGRGPLPSLAVKCIASWKKFLPDYEIKEWNEDNFDVNIIPYTAEAYEAKKFAFVSDYARFWILYKYGGLYFDTDVEIVKPMDDIIVKGAFMGCENEVITGIPLFVAPGLGLGCEAGHSIYFDLMDIYNRLHFFNTDGSMNQKTVVQYTTEYLERCGLRKSNDIQFVNGMWIYPKEYFCPMDYETQELIFTDNTRTIHYYAASWQPRTFKIGKKIRGVVGDKIYLILINMRRWVLGKQQVDLL